MPESVAVLDPQPFDSLPVGVVSVDSGGTVLQVNQCLAAWLGQSPQALVGRPIDQCLTRAARALYHTHVLPTLQLHGRLQELALWLDAGGTALPVLACASLTQQPGGAVVQLVLSPMRERLRVEAELIRARRAADSAPVVLFEYELNAQGRGSFGYTSAGLRTLYGQLAEAHLPDARVWACVHPDDLPGLLQARAESARTLAAWSRRYRARAPGSEAWVWHGIDAQPERGAEGQVVWYGTIADVTRQREMEQAEQQREAAQQASQAKSEFLARMSHELRTPLNGIIGFAQLLQIDQAHPLHADQRRRLQIVAASGQRLLALINEVLDISRIEAGRLQLELQALPLQPLLQQAVAAVEPMSAAAGLTVALHCPPGVAVLGDALRLGQVMANLLSNAVKYNRNQGVVDVTVAAQGAELAIQVRDTGPGMTTAQLQQLFQPFNRLGAERSQTEGSGLGLVIARQLVQAMGGRLEVRSQLGQGSVFSVMLPCAEAQATEPVAAVPVDKAASRPGQPQRRVLYVEDSPVNALLVSQVLETLGTLAVRVEPSGESALQAVAQWQPELLLLDMNLGDMDGFELLSRVRALPGMRQVPAVAVSADAMPEHVGRALAHGFQDYWTKPLDVPRLLADVRSLVESQAR